MLRAALLLGLSLFAVSGCAVSPYAGQQLSSNVVPFDGFAHASSASILIEAYNWNTASFEYVVTAVASATPTFAAGTFCPNSPELFRYKRDVTLNSSYWKLDHGRRIAKVRAAQVKGTSRRAISFTDNPEAGHCVVQNANTQTCDFYDVSYNQCGYTLNEVTVSR